MGANGFLTFAASTSADLAAMHGVPPQFVTTCLPAVPHAVARNLTRPAEARFASFAGGDVLLQAVQQGKRLLLVPHAAPSHALLAAQGWSTLQFAAASLPDDVLDG